MNDLAAAEVWLKAHEAEGYIFTSCVLVNEHGHVTWLRGNPGEWNRELIDKAICLQIRRSRPNKRRLSANLSPRI